MNAFEEFVSVLRREVPFQIKYKDESPEMIMLGVLVEIWCPGFMTRYTTVIGSTVYFPSRYFVEQHQNSSLRILAHEAVHLLDQRRYGTGPFMLGYLFPQILAAGVLLAPWFGPMFMLCLLFLLPLPAPFRFLIEARGYAIDYLTAAPERREEVLDYIAAQFSGWGYYRMWPFEASVRRTILHFAERAEAGHDSDILRVLLLYEMIRDS